MPDRHLWPTGEEEIGGRRGTVVYWQDGCGVALRKPCVFCTIFHTPRPTRRTVDQVVAEMAVLSEMGYGFLEDGGDDFALGGARTLQWLDELADAMQAESRKFGWLIHSTAHSLVASGPRMLEALCRVGVRILQVGFESGEQGLKIKEKASPEEERQLLSTAKALAMKVCGAWILGMPGETPETMERTVGEARAMYDQGLLAGIMMDPLWPGPGSPAFEAVCRYRPEWRDADFVDPHDLMLTWYRHFTTVNVDMVLNVREEFLKEVEVEIVGGMLL